MGVTGADFDLVMTGATGQLLHCSGDASVTKSCNLPLGTGSLTFEGMSFPIAPGSVPVNVDIKLSSLLPGHLPRQRRSRRPQPRMETICFVWKLTVVQRQMKTVPNSA